ncbi:MAG: hypothetical protein U0L85_00590 [Bacilli bacterium]|nr:hypothetical protein [Bacilli bacterium]
MIDYSWGTPVISVWMSEDEREGNDQEWFDDYQIAIENLALEAYYKWFESHPKNYIIDQFADKYIDAMLNGYTVERQQEIMIKSENTSNIDQRYKNAPTVL